MAARFGTVCALAAAVGCGVPAAPTVSVAPVSVPPPPPVEVVRPEPASLEVVEAEPMRPGPMGRGWLGVELGAPVPGEAGVPVLRVVPTSPAARAGLAPGDVLLSIDGGAVNEPSDVVGAVAGRGAGTEAAVVLRRGGAERLLRVELGAYPDHDAIVRMTFVDRPAPPLEQLKVVKGSLVPSLRALRGRVVVLEFWAPWCVACRTLIPHLNAWHAQYAPRGLAVLGVTASPAARAAQAATELGLEYAVLADDTGRTTEGYEARAIPVVYVIDREGIVRDLLVGYDAAGLFRLESLVRKLLARG